MPDAQQRSGRGHEQLESRVLGNPVRPVRRGAVGKGRVTHLASRLPDQVNRLKCVKRAMYGRAKFDLLRRRVLGYG